MNGISIVALSTVIGIIATLLTLYRETKKDTISDIRQHTSVSEEIKYISKGVDDIKYDTKSLTTSIANMNERLIRAEESIKSAHEKIDNHIHIKGDI